MTIDWATHQPRLWRLAHTMLGVPADADEVVQEAFERAIRHLPDDGRPAGPWLCRVTVNLARDRLRQRRRRGYVGPWLPVPTADGDWLPELLPSSPIDDPVERLDGARFAALLALERTTPNQRAVWALRDLLGCSVRETADLLDLTETNVKVTLHRARRALRDGDVVPDASPDAVAAVGAFLAALATGDVARVVATLTPDAVALADGGGETFAAKVPVIGAARVAKVYVHLAADTVGADVRFGSAGGLPALFVGAPPGSRWPSALLLFDVADGRVRRVWSVSAPRKLRRAAVVR